MASLPPLSPAFCWAFMIWACFAQEIPERSTPFQNEELHQLSSARVGITLSEEDGYPARGNQQERYLERLKSGMDLEKDRKLAESDPGVPDVPKQGGDSRTGTEVPKESGPNDPTTKTKNNHVSSDVAETNFTKSGAEFNMQGNEDKPINKPSGSTGNHGNPPPPEKIAKDSKILPDGSNNQFEKGGPSLDPKQLKDCDGHHGCDVGKLSACLDNSQAGSKNLSLLVQNKGDKIVDVKVNFPEFLRVEPASLTLEKGGRQLARIAVVDYGAAMKMQAVNITISIGNEDCRIEVDSKYLHKETQQNFLQGFFHGLPYMSMMTPMVLAYVLLFIFAVVLGIWLYCRYRRKRRHLDFKYQELEMGLPSEDVPKYQQKKGSKPDDEHTDGWDEVWNEDWEVEETARSSSLHIESLSSKGLATRRSNKDGWDNSWDD